MPTAHSPFARCGGIRRARASNRRTSRLKARLLLTFGWGLCFAPLATEASAGLPDVVVITIDTLRPDRLSLNGYGRRTSPSIDALIASGARFSNARTPIPLTCPAMASMLTGLHPHEHGATRNGLPIREGLPSFAKRLRTNGYATAAFVGNWALSDHLCGLAEHFDRWDENLSTRPSLFAGLEADADQLTTRALKWLRSRARRGERPPILLWLHYMDPHSPYSLNTHVLSQLGLGLGAFFSIEDRYDSEIAHVDRSVGEFLTEADALLDLDETIVLFASDHGESFGEHGYWGHGDNLSEEGLRIPLAITWPSRIDKAEIRAVASSIDVGGTLLGLIGDEANPDSNAFDWTRVLTKSAAPPRSRVTRHQAHGGTVAETADKDRARRNGLLAVALVTSDGTRILSNAGDATNLATGNDHLTRHREPAPELVDWYGEVSTALSGLPASQELRLVDRLRLRALGYAD